MEIWNRKKSKFLGKTGALSEVLKGLKDVAPQDRPIIGGLANELRDAFEKAIAEKIEGRLAQTITKSTLPKENAGLVEDQELVAIGRHNTVDAVSLLIEYGYIYEPWILNPIMRDIQIKELARQTVLGIEDFF